MPRILRIPEAASLGLHAAAILAENDGERVSVPDLARSLGASEAHLSKVMQRLAKAGLVRSVRGPRGGFALALPAEAVSLLDLYEAIEGPVESATCLFQTPVCGREACIFGGYLAEFDARFRSYLAETTLGELARQKEVLDVRA